MYDRPAYIWAITIATTAAANCIVLYSGAEHAGLGRRRAALLAGGAAMLIGGGGGGWSRWRQASWWWGWT